MTIQFASHTGSAERPRAAGATVGVTLVVIAALHIAWALGSSWPFGDREAMSQVVWGGPESTFPSAAGTVVVAAMIAAAGLVVAGRAGLGGDRRPRWVFAAGTWTVAVVMLLRAVVYGLGSIGSDAVNVAWEQRLFTPLCFVLGILCVVVARRGEHRV